MFISYSRRDIDFARRITQAFKSQKLDFWIDWEGIPPTVDWWKEIQKGIEEADIFLFLLSPDSAKSNICRKEIGHAIANGKRLIPVVIRDVKAEEAPPELQPLNWIFLRESDVFADGFDKLMTAVKTDYEWVQTHRQLQVKALEWDRSSRENSFLLRGKELRDAESQLAANSQKEPYPTDLQRGYVIASKKASIRQRRIIASVLATAIILVIWLAYTPAKSWLTKPEMPYWAPITFYQGDAPRIVTMNLRNPDEVYASGQAKGSFYRSINGGNTWQLITAPDMENEIIGLAAVDNRLYALTGQSLWLTQDKGETWSSVKNPLPDLQAKFLSIGINPHNAEEIFIGANNGIIYHAKNDGAYWDIVQPGYEGILINAVAANGALIIVATEEGLWVKNVKRNNWKELSLAGCSDTSDEVGALSFTRPYETPPIDGAYGFFSAVPKIGICDSDTLNLHKNSKVDLSDPPDANVTSIVIADIPGWTYEGYIILNNNILRKRIWYSNDLEWWKLKTKTSFTKGE